MCLYICFHHCLFYFLILCVQIVLQTLLSFVMTCYGIVHIAGEFKDMDASSELKNKWVDFTSCSTFPPLMMWFVCVPLPLGKHAHRLNCIYSNVTFNQFPQIHTLKPPLRHRYVILCPLCHNGQVQFYIIHLFFCTSSTSVLKRMHIRQKINNMTGKHYCFSKGQVV